MNRDPASFQISEAVAEATRARMADHKASCELAKQLKERGIVVRTERRRFDWVAVDDATYYYIGDPMGVGRTEQEAIENLVQQLDEGRKRIRKSSRYSHSSRGAPGNDWQRLRTRGANVSSEYTKGMAQEYKAERDEFENEVLALRSQNAELVEALRDLLERVDRNGGIGEYKGGQAFVTGKARALLARAKP